MSKKQDRVIYLNKPGVGLFTNRLVEALNAMPAKVVSAPPAGWITNIKSLASKGVKQSEIDDSKIIGYLEGLVGTVKSVARNEILEQVMRSQVTVKEVLLAKSQFQSWSHHHRGKVGQYAELLFIANDEHSNIKDRMDELEFELEQYNFDIELLSNNPEGIFALELERKSLMNSVGKAFKFDSHHFTSSAGAHGKNLIAHARFTKADGVFFIEEMQSDWAQRGRKTNWNGVPVGPFVTDTKLWAGLVGRRLLQLAALDESIHTVAWITAKYRNGWIDAEEDGLNEFYLKTIPSIFDKVSGAKSKIGPLMLGALEFTDAPQFAMTPEVRDKLKEVMPVYSMAPLLPVAEHDLNNHERYAMFARTHHLLGSASHLRLAKTLYDISTGQEVAGRYINRMIQVSMKAADPRAALDHEAFHFAFEQLLSDSDRYTVSRDFAPGTVLNARVQDLLLRNNCRAAAMQCSSAEECASHAFAMYCNGEFEFDTPARGIFQRIKEVLLDCAALVYKVGGQTQSKTTQQVFAALDAGGYATPILTQHKNNQTEPKTTQHTTQQPNNNTADLPRSLLKPMYRAQSEQSFESHRPRG